MLCIYIYIGLTKNLPDHSTVHISLLLSLCLSFREFEGSIQRYQWFFSELPEMLCESEMEVEQHTCWSGQDVVERCVCRRSVALIQKWDTNSQHLMVIHSHLG